MSLKSRILYVFLFAVVIPTTLFASGDGEVSHNLISSIGISIITATATAFFGNLFKQPLLLMYIAAGAIIGPNVGLGLVESQEEIAIISEIGLILLLFMIGLEIDVKKLMESGKTLILSGVLQFVICVVLGFVFFSLLGYTVGEGKFDLIYLTVCCALSSTTIVVKVLYSKFELDTLAGHICLGVLIFQDIWAILFLSIQPNLSNPEVTGMLLSFAKGFLLIVISLGLSKYILPRLFRSIAKVPELLLVSSLGWCFLICGIANYLSLSIEMGALIAGVAISTFPYNIDVIAKVTNIRDFFITLFFVALGMQVPNPLENLALVKIALLVVAAVVLMRFVSLYPLLYSLKNGHRVSLLSSINLSNVSEFSLVICSIGVTAGHISQDILTTIIFIFVSSSIIAPYFIKYSDPIQKSLTKVLLKVGLKDISDTEEKTYDKPSKDIALLGIFRDASSLIAEIEDFDEKNGKEMGISLKDGLVVVDFNPNVHQKLQAKNIDVVYGDISNMDTLHHANIHNTKIIISTIPDSILVGTDNLKMIKQLKTIAPHAKIVVTAESIKRALNMYQEGADFVLLPRIHAAQTLLPVLVDILHHKDSSEDRKKQQMEWLQGREEIIS
jgi:Kef-type K+ transport system membrane component KefB